MRAALSLLLVLATTSTVVAAPRMVFRFDARELSTEMERVAEQFSTAITRELGGVQAAFSIADAARTQCIATTKELSDDCLDQIAENHLAKRLVWGEVSSIEGGLRVTLTRYVRGKNQQRRSFELRGTVTEMTDTLVEGARSWFEDLGVDARRDRDRLATDTTWSSPRTSGGVQKPTIVLLIGGGTVLAAGAGFLYSASQIASELRETRPRTQADFSRVVVLEREGKQRQLIGSVLAGAGVVTVGYAIVRALAERKSGSDTSVERLTARGRIAPVPIEGGAALVYERPLH